MGPKRPIEILSDDDDDGEGAEGTSANGQAVSARSSQQATAVGRGKSSKKTKLDGYFAVPLPKRPTPYGVSDPLNDKDSLFVAFAAQCESQHQASKLREYVTQIAASEYMEDPASHVMQGSRILVARPGSVDAFETKTFAVDDGESKGGRTIVDALAAANAVDVSVCVARWFGGSMLGPRRFDDIAQCATGALYRLRDDEEVQELKKQLEDKDDDVQQLLTALNQLQGKAAPTALAADYENLDLAKAKRLLAARTLRLSNLQTQLNKAKELEDEELPDLPGSAKEA